MLSNTPHLTRIGRASSAHAASATTSSSRNKNGAVVQTRISRPSAAKAALPLRPEPRPRRPRSGSPLNVPRWWLTQRLRASTTATSTLITINAGHGKQGDHHAPQCPASPRNAASPGPGEAERQPRGACRGRDRQIRARKPACPGPPKPRSATGYPVRGIIFSVRACGEMSGRHPGPSCPRPWPHPHERSVTGRRAAPPGSPNAPVMSDPGNSEAEPGHVAGVADHGGGDDRAGAENAGQAGTRCLDRDGQRRSVAL
jgi:hypothetical protein